MIFTKFQENRLIIDGEINEKHALLVSCGVKYNCIVQLEGGGGIYYLCSYCCYHLSLCVPLRHTNVNLSLHRSLNMLEAGLISYLFVRQMILNCHDPTISRIGSNDDIPCTFISFYIPDHSHINMYPASKILEGHL